MDEKLFFLHKIIAPADLEESSSSTMYSLIMESVEYENKSDGEEVFEEAEIDINEYGIAIKEERLTVDLFHKITHLYEGCFLSKNLLGLWVKDNSKKVAKSLIGKSNRLRGYLKKYVVEPSDVENEYISNVSSYHINVGHGNTSLIVFKQSENYHIWMVDCACRELKTNINYISHLKKCFQHINNKYGLDNLSIEKLMITHAHYDHISTINDLIEMGCFVDGTEVWLNINFSYASKTYIKVLAKILKRCKNNGWRIVDPVVHNSTRHIKVWYPQSDITGTRNGSFNKAPDGKVNNSSVVYTLNLGGDRMVFPGDIETAGWNHVGECVPYMEKAKYYCVSHHGSITGHLRNKCPAGRTISDVSTCCGGVDKAILMGRNGAFKGIFSPMVINSFSNKLHVTENANNFLEIDWRTGTINYI